MEPFGVPVLCVRFRPDGADSGFGKERERDGRVVKSSHLPQALLDRFWPVVGKAPKSPLPLSYYESQPYIHPFHNAQ